MTVKELLSYLEDENKFLRLANSKGETFNLLISYDLWKNKEIKELTPKIVFYQTSFLSAEDRPLYTGDLDKAEAIENELYCLNTAVSLGEIAKTIFLFKGQEILGENLEIGVYSEERIFFTKGKTRLRRSICIETIVKSFYSLRHEHAVREVLVMNGDENE